MDRREFNCSLLGAVAALSLPGWLPGQARLHVDGARIHAHLAALAEFGKNTAGGVSRVAYTEADRQGREAVMAWMREAKLDPVIDAAANLAGRRAGRDPALKPIALGSHVDSVPDGGNYDGDVGSLEEILADDFVKAARPHPRRQRLSAAQVGFLDGPKQVAGWLA